MGEQHQLLKLNENIKYEHWTTTTTIRVRWSTRAPSTNFRNTNSNDFNFFVREIREASVSPLSSSTRETKEEKPNKKKSSIYLVHDRCTQSNESETIHIVNKMCFEMRTFLRRQNVNKCILILATRSTNNGLALFNASHKTIIKNRKKIKKVKSHRYGRHCRVHGNRQNADSGHRLENQLKKWITILCWPLDSMHITHTTHTLKFAERRQLWRW